MKVSNEWIQLILPLLVFAGLFLFRYVTLFARGRGLREIAPHLNAEAVLWPFVPPRIRGNYTGVPFQMVFLPAGRGSTGRMQIRLSFSFPFGMEVRPRGAMQGLELLLVRGRTLETGDEAFDEAVHARADKEKEKAELYLDNPVNRDTLLLVFREGFELVRFTPRELVLTKPGDFLGGNLTPEGALHDLAMAARLMQRV